MITTFGADQIGADPAGYCAIQGPDGLLYVGGNGLLTYDGDRWTMTAVPGIDGIYGLDFGSDGRVWAAAEGDVGWFDRTSNGRWNFHSLKPWIDAGVAVHGQVWAIAADPVGCVFVTGERVYHWDGAQIRSWLMPVVRPRHLLRFGGEICVKDFQSGLYRIRANGPELISPSELGATEPGVVLWAGENSKRWLYQTANSVSLLGQDIHRTFPASTAQVLIKGGVIGVVALPEGRFAFDCWKTGIVITNGDGVIEQILREADGVPGYVHSLFVDREGLLWALSHVGIKRLDVNSATRVFDERAGVPVTPYRDIGSAHGVAAIGTAEGAMVLDSDLRHFSKLSIGISAHVLSSAPNGLLLGSRTGAWLRTPDSTTLLLALPAEAQTATSSRFHPGDTFVTVYDATIVTASKDHPPRRVVENLPVVGASLAEDRGDLLWIGTDTHGLFVAHLDPEQAVTPQRPSPRYGLPNFSGAVYVRGAPGGDIVVVGNNGAWVKPARTEVFQKIRDYPDRPFTAVANALDDGSVWLIQGESGSLAPCVALISPEGGWHWTPHSIADLETIGTPRGIGAEKDEMGSTVLWIGGSKSVLRHVVEHGPVSPRPMAPLLWAFKRNSRDERQLITSAIPYSTHAVEFELAEPEFAHRGSIHLETKIVGIDPGWMPVNKDSRRELTAIRDGRYTFQVRAVAETGMVSEPTVFTFDVAPPWWRSRLALWLEIGTVVALVYLGIQWRVRTLHRRNEELERKVKERTEELAEASAAKTQFVANMSHDIRNPLNGIVGLTLALEDTPLDGQQRELIATLRECTSYLSSLVDDVLDFASIEAGRVEIRSAPFVPAELLNSVVTTLKAECTARGTLVTIETDPDIPPVLQGDAGRIQQILVNYVSNALKYAPGHIRLGAALSPDAPGEVEFAVADEGGGISPSDQATLFTKFTRLGAARRSQLPGTGLGLAACRLLADVMGGSVGVDSEVGRGSRFFLRLPLVVATEPILTPDNLKLPPTTVLLVEDTDYNALAAKAVLAKLGLGCDRARTGAEAIQLFAQKRHHIVLLDRNLPDLDGTEVAARMRELETDGLHAVLLAVTAYCTAEDRKLCLAAGMDAFLGKPLTPDKLRKVLLGAANQILSTPAFAATVDSPPVATTPELKLDTSLLEYLASGTNGGVGAQAERFIAELNQAGAALVSIADGGTSTVIADAAHRVLGNARMVGATPLIELLIQCEIAARQADRATIAALLPKVQAQIEIVTAALRRHPAVQPK